MAGTLLLADGNPTIQRIVALTFAGQGFTVRSVNDGDEAIAAITAERPDIVLADVSMPKTSGYEVAAFVKQRPDLADIPVLLLSGALEPVDEARARAVKCDGVLVKPFEPQQVVDRVRELVRGAKGHSTQTVAGVPRPIDRLLESRAPAETRRDTGAAESDQASPKEVTAKAIKHPSAFGRPTRMPAAGPKGSADDPLGDYFDRLDVAFGAAEPPQRDSLPADVHVDEAERLDLPTLSSVLGDLDRDPVAQPPGPKGLWDEEPRNPFAMLIAADRQARDEDKARAQAAAAKIAAPAIDDALVEAVAARVLAKLAPHGVADLVSRVVADVAERLVREEIARIRDGK